MKIEELKRGNVSVIYDSDKINRKIIRRENSKNNIFIFILILMVLIIPTYLTTQIENTILSCCVLAGSMLVILIGGITFMVVLHYKNMCPSYDFIEWLMRTENIYVDYFGGRLLFRVGYKDKTIKDYRADNFVSSIRIEDFNIEEIADKTKPIHVVIDVSDDNVCKILVENEEE